MACSSCGKKLSDNLGKCKKCVILSFTLSIILWFITLYGLPLIEQQSLIFYLKPLVIIWASLFSLLFIAHVLGYLKEKLKSSN